MPRDSYTKLAIAKEMKELMCQKPFEQIRVKDLLDRCGISRKCFYYHFKDKYDVVNWIFSVEIIDPIIEDTTLEGLTDCYLRLCHYIRDNQSFCTSAFRVIGQNSVIENLYHYVKRQLEILCSTYLLERALTPSDLHFLTSYYYNAFAGVVLDWVEGGLQYTPEQIVCRWNALIRNNLEQYVRILTYSGEQGDSSPLSSPIDTSESLCPCDTENLPNRMKVSKDGRVKKLDEKQPYKVIIWGLGSVARIAVRMIQERKGLELVGAIDVDPRKVGKDAGEVFGFEKTGVIVSDDADQVLSQDADVVLAYLPTDLDAAGNINAKPAVDSFCKALNAKKNVITTVPINNYRELHPEIFNQLDECAKENGVTYTPYGLLPGAFGSYLPVILSGIIERVDKIIMNSGEDDQHNTSGWLPYFGYGKDPETFDSEALGNYIINYYKVGVYEIGERLGFKFDDFKGTHEVMSAPQDLPTDFGGVKKGTIYAHRFVMSGYQNGEEVVSLRYVHRVCHTIVADPPIDSTIHIEGLVPLDIRIDGMIPQGEGYVTSTAPTISAIPSVVEAQPGWQQALDLRTIVPVL